MQFKRRLAFLPACSLGLRKEQCCLGHDEVQRARSGMVPPSFLQHQRSTDTSFSMCSMIMPQFVTADDMHPRWSPDIGELHFLTKEDGKWQWKERFMSIPCALRTKDRISDKDLKRSVVENVTDNPGFLDAPQIRPSVTIYLKKGGCLRIWRNLLTQSARKRIAKEMKKNVTMRQYQVQGFDEPRVHCLLHECDRPGEIPFYKYGSTTLRASPLRRHKYIHRFSQVMRKVAGVEKWDIGVNPIIYRSNRDYIGKHADNAQGETTIITAIITQDAERVLVIEPKVQEEGVERIRLTLEEGDVYSMDGEMQKYYVHSVPPSRRKGEDIENPKQRFVLVFRDGQYLADTKEDAAKTVGHLSPRPKLDHTFGSVPALEYDKAYTRKELYESGGHLMAQRSICGNKVIGCSALIVSGKEDDRVVVWDAYGAFVHAAEPSSGAASLQKAFELQQSIRVYRSSSVDNTIQASSMKKCSVSQSYRPDGLYKIQRMESLDNGLCVFLLVMENLDTEGRNCMGGLSSLFAPEWTWDVGRPPLRRKWGNRVDRQTFERIFREAKGCAGSAMDTDQLLHRVRSELFDFSDETDVDFIPTVVHVPSSANFHVAQGEIERPRRRRKTFARK